MAKRYEDDPRYRPRGSYGGATSRSNVPRPKPPIGRTSTQPDKIDWNQSGDSFGPATGGSPSMHDWLKHSSPIIDATIRELMKTGPLGAWLEKRDSANPKKPSQPSLKNWLDAWAAERKNEKFAAGTRDQDIFVPIEPKTRPVPLPEFYPLNANQPGMPATLEAGKETEVAAKKSSGRSKATSPARSTPRTQSAGQKMRSTPGPERLSAAMKVANAQGKRGTPDSTATAKVIQSWNKKPTGRSRTR